MRKRGTRTPGGGRRDAANVAIIGAGPYGLCAAAHLRGAGVETIAFGEPMSFWERNMPVGMFLRSSRRASSIADPGRELTIDHYEREAGLSLANPLPLDDFVAYAHWFRGRAMPDCDTRSVVRVDTASDGFTLTLDDGETTSARRVVVATGIARFAYLPRQFAGLPAELVSHSSAIRDVGVFSGRRVLVVGGGQSALEDTALLHEAGAETQVVARTPRIRWLRPAVGKDAGAAQRLIQRIKYPPTDVGPPGLNWIAGAPDVFRRMPRGVQPEIGVRCMRPAVSPWLAPRVDDVRINAGRTVISAVAAGDGVRITFDDGDRCEVDHVVLATGYRVDVSKYPFLGPEVLRSLELVDGYPRLTTGLESSVPGLHFLGAPAAATFGPVMRFITGTWYCGPALTRRVTGKPPLALRFAW